MTILDRLKMELNNKRYFEDDFYIQLLKENNINDLSIEYDKSAMQKDLLYTVIDVLEAVCNDIDVLRRVETEFETTDGAYKALQNRIRDIRDRIKTIPDGSTNENEGHVSMFFGSRW